MRKRLRIALAVVLGVVALVLLVSWVIHHVQTECDRLCLEKTGKTITWVYPPDCICRGEEFPIWERKRLK